MRLLRTGRPWLCAELGGLPLPGAPGDLGSSSGPSSSLPGPQGCLSAGRRSPINSSWQPEEARQVCAVPSVSRLIIYLFVFNKKLTFLVKLCPGKITIVFQVESSYYCGGFGGCDKIFIDVKVPCGLARVGSAEMGPPFPRGVGSRAAGREGDATRSEETSGFQAPGAPRALRSRGTSPGEEPSARRRARPSTPPTS